MKPLTNNTPLTHISKISIKKLFGYYSYSFPGAGSLSELVIVYADNGAGKTTLLRLIFQILSTSRSQGHKTSLAETSFSELEIGLSNGRTIIAKRANGLLTGPVTFEILSPKELVAKWDFDPARDESNVTTEHNIERKTWDRLPAGIRKQLILAMGKQKFFEELDQLNVSCFILTPDRILLGGEQQQKQNDQYMRSRSDSLSDLLLQSRSNSLARAIVDASDLVRKKVFRGTYNSGNSANQIYDTVLSQILDNKPVGETGLTPAKLKESLRKKLNLLNEDYAKFSNYGLAAKIETDELMASIDKAKGAKVPLVHSIIEPYINSLQARAQSLQEVYGIVDSFVRNVNVFLKDKQLQFKAASGFSIRSTLSPQGLEVSQLSSGEQQLLLMFFHVLAARDTSSIFIIDEPEISLNIKWQRILVASLLEVARESGIQLIFSSHSFEILAKHRDSVISLQDLSFKPVS